MRPTAPAPPAASTPNSNEGAPAKEIALGQAIDSVVDVADPPSRTTGERPWSPHVGRVSVVAGQQYRLAVGLAGTGELGGPFVLTTRME